MAAPTVEAEAFSNTDTVSLTVTSGNRIAVAVYSETTATHDSVARDGQSFTQIGTSVTVSSGGAQVRVSWWELGSPNVNTSNVVATTSSGTIRVGVEAYSLVGAAAAQATRGTDSSTGDDTTAACTFTVDNNDSLVLDCLGIGNAALSPVKDAAQTEYVNAQSGGTLVADRCRCAGSGKTVAAGSVTMTWDMSAASSFRHAMIAVAFPPSAAPAAGGGAYYRKRRSHFSGRGL